jgi:hypothetical protein
MTLSTTSPGDEREAFDRWHISKWRDVIDFNGIPNAWEAWQARAALSSSTVQQVGAEPSQSGSAGEAELPSPCNIINGVWYYSAEQMRAALSRQAPAAPAAVDFEQWWLAEVAANGGVPIGADYKHWAKAGFELRGDARAPAAPAEAGRSDQWGRLYNTANTLVASIGYMGEIDSRADEVASLMDALHDLDGGQWMPGLTPAASPAAPTQALLGWTRYEKARKLNPAQWAELHQRNLRGENFDDMIDALPATTQPVQIDRNGREVKRKPALRGTSLRYEAAPTPAEPAQQDTKGADHG